MIKRLPTKCTTCGHANTLRITLGINQNQHHVFECQGCGEECSVDFELDFIDREKFSLPGLGVISGPRMMNLKLGNAERTEEEGTITNLDSTFLVPEEELHQDMAFSWMHAMPHVLNDKFDKPGFFDIADQAGMSWGIKEAIAATLKAVDLNTRGKTELVDAQLEIFSKICKTKVDSIPRAVAMIMSAVLGREAAAKILPMSNLVTRAQALNPTNFQKMIVDLRGKLSPDFFDRQLIVLKDYLKGYDQFSQAWFYAASDINFDERLQPSVRALDVVKHFYSTAFENLSSGLILPACLNNILSGRDYDVFESMDIKKYLAIDKAGRAKCFEKRTEFAPLWDEFDSTLRNGSAHQGLRMKSTSKYMVQYRTGDSQAWKEISYTNYLLRCNKIQFCLLRLLALQMYVFGPSAFERKLA